MFNIYPFGSEIRITKGDGYKQTYHIVGHTGRMLRLGHIHQTAKDYQVEDINYLISPDRVEAV